MPFIADTFTVCSKKLLPVNAIFMKLSCDIKGPFLLVPSYRLEMKTQDLKPKVIELELNFWSPKFSYLIRVFSKM